MESSTISMKSTRESNYCTENLLKRWCRFFLDEMIVRISSFHDLLYWRIIMIITLITKWMIKTIYMCSIFSGAARNQRLIFISRHIIYIYLDASRAFSPRVKSLFLSSSSLRSFSRRVLLRVFFFSAERIDVERRRRRRRRRLQRGRRVAGVLARPGHTTRVFSL